VGHHGGFHAVTGRAAQPAVPRTKQFVMPGKRAFAGEPTTEFSMMEIADVNLDSLRSKRPLAETVPPAEPEVNEPFRLEPFTVHWRSALGRKDAALDTKRPGFWLGANGTLSVTPNLVRRFMGRRGPPVVSTTLAAVPSSGVVGISNININAIRPERNTSYRSADNSSAGVDAGDRVTSTADSVNTSAGGVDLSSSSEGAAVPFIKWEGAPEVPDNKSQTSKVGIFTGAVAHPAGLVRGKSDVIPDTTEQSLEMVSDIHDLFNLSGDNQSGAAHNKEKEDSSLFGSPSSSSTSETTHGVGSQPTVSANRLQDKAAGDIERTFRSSPGAGAVSSLEGLSHSTEHAVSAAAGEVGRLNESMPANGTPSIFTELTGEEIAAVKNNSENLEPRLKGTLSSEPAAHTFNVSEVPTSGVSAAAERTFVRLNESNVLAHFSNKPSISYESGAPFTTSSLSREFGAGSLSMPAGGFSPRSVISNADINLPAFSTSGTVRKVYKNIAESEATPRSGRATSSNISSANLESQSSTVTKGREPKVPPAPSTGEKNRDRAILDIGNFSSGGESALKPSTERLGGAESTTARINNETSASAGNGASLFGKATERTEDYVPYQNYSQFPPGMLSNATVGALKNDSNVAPNKYSLLSVSSTSITNAESPLSSTHGTESNVKNDGGLLVVGKVPEGADKVNVSALTVFPKGAGETSSRPTSAANDSSSVAKAINGTKLEEGTETPSDQNNVTHDYFTVWPFAATEGVNEGKARSEQKATEEHSLKHAAQGSVPGGSGKPEESNGTSSGISSEIAEIFPSGSTHTPHDLLDAKSSAEIRPTGDTREVGLSKGYSMGSSGQDGNETQEAAVSSKADISSRRSTHSPGETDETTVAQISTLRTRRKIRMSRRGRYRRRSTATATTVDATTTSQSTVETTEHAQNRYPSRKRLKKKRHTRPTSAAKLSSEFASADASKAYLNSTPSTERAFNASDVAGEEAARNTTENETGGATGSYKQNIKAVAVTHRHDPHKKQNVSVRASQGTMTPSRSARSQAGTDDATNDLGLFSDQTNDTDALDGTYQHAGMNLWEIPNSASGLQKEHPSHKRKARPRDSRRLPPKAMPKHIALTRLPYTVPIEWTAERKRSVRTLPSTSTLNPSNTSALLPNLTEGSWSASPAKRERDESPEPVNETQEAPNTSAAFAPTIKTFNNGLSVVGVNITEVFSEDASASSEPAIKDAQPTSRESSGEQTNDSATTVGKFASNDSSEISQSPVPTEPSTTPPTLVPFDDSVPVVRCGTADCMEEGGRLHAFTDLSQKPCTNFYEFSCSGWVRTHPYPSNRRKISVDDLIVQVTEQKTMEYIYENALDHATYTDPLLHNLVKLFQGCSDKSFLMKNPALALQTALDDVRLTDWPYDEEPMDLEIPEVMAFAARKLAVHPFFAPSLETDSTTGSGWIFVLKEPRPVVAEDAYLAGDVASKYQKHVTKSMSLVNSDKNIQALSEPVLDVDQEVYKFVEKNRRFTDYTKEHHRKGLQHLDKRREFDVGSFLSTLLDGIAVLDSEVEFVIPTQSFLEDVQNITMAFEKNVLLNYIGFRVVLSLAPLLPHNDGRDLAHLLFAREIPTRTPAKRWRFCLRLMENVYKLPLLKLQVDSFEKKDTFHTINRTMELLKKHFFRTARNSSRLGQRPREIVILKLRGLRVQSSSSHLIGDPEVRERHYHGVPDVDPSNVLTDYIQTLTIVLKNYWSYYGNMGPQFRWHGSVFDTVATYNHFENTLYIPPSLFMEDVKYNTFHSPLYFPRSGRRIMEALYGMLEREGSFFGLHNEVVKSSNWDYATTDGYLSLRGCLKEQFRRAAMPHLVPGLMSAVHPSRPLRQDVRDSAIVNIVFEAFKETMLDFGYKPGVFVLPGFAETSMDQLFFLLYGTSQCELSSQEAALSDEVINAAHPRRYRLNNALQNNGAFSRAFMCGNGTDMNPKNKCKVW
ncbi:LOW QUALITY PROTEIN: uncharacterized protein LOC144123072, partial [Amblyomma americanum]